MTSKRPPSSYNSRLDRDVTGINVDLWPTESAAQAANRVAAFYYSTWGDLTHPDDWFDFYNVPRGDEDSWLIAQRAMAGQVLPNTLESVALTFGFSGISRATTHQLVRTRVGAVFGQQGGRDNDWSDYNMRLSETWFTTMEPDLVDQVMNLQKAANSLYQLALQLGVPYQDARYVLPMGLETALVGSYNLLSVKSLLARRLCNRMMWETNWVARLMHDAVVHAFPWVGRSLRSSCERGVCQSVSPMFPNSCWSYGEHGARLSKDNPVLEETIKKQGLEFTREANAANRWGEMDSERINREIEDKSIVVSLTDPDLVIARKRDGKWIRA